MVFAGGTDRVTDMVEGWLALSAVVAPRYAAKSVRTLPLCDVSRPSMTCPFRMVLGAVVAVAAGERAVGPACGRVPNGAGGVGYTPSSAASQLQLMARVSRWLVDRSS